MATKTKTKASDAVLVRLREVGLGYPGAHTKSPWPGHLDLAVNDKTFAYLSLEGDPLKISCKLPRSGDVALMLEHTEPAAYGLGKSGWVTAKFPEDVEPPVDVLLAWIDESYRAQAPKKLVAELDGRGASKVAVAEKNATKKVAAKKTVPAKKVATKKTVPAKRDTKR